MIYQYAADILILLTEKKTSYQWQACAAASSEL